VAQLFRHGESESNAGLPTNSAASPRLTPLGIRQANLIAERLTDAPSLFVVSSYLRTHQTAAPSIAKFPHVPVQIWPIHEFTFLSGERYNGTTPAQRATAVKAYWERLDPEYRDGNDSESFEAFHRRVQDFLLRMREHPADNVAVFGHGHFLRAVMMEIEAQRAPLTAAGAMKEYATRWLHEAVGNGERFLLYRRATPP
jgi:broad specificity phosphatase PhoE